MFPNVFREHGLYVIHFISTHLIHTNLPGNFNFLYFKCCIEYNSENLENSCLEMQTENLKRIKTYIYIYIYICVCRQAVA
jgi:hypothetical protein